MRKISELQGVLFSLEKWEKLGKNTWNLILATIPGIARGILKTFKKFLKKCSVLITGHREPMGSLKKCHPIRFSRFPAIANICIQLQIYYKRWASLEKLNIWKIFKRFY